jgi:hypothetical protein
VSNYTKDERVAAFAQLLEEDPKATPQIMKSVRLRVAPKLEAAGVPFVLERTATSSTVIATSYAEIESKLTDWAWEAKMPRAMLSLVVGTEGLGKTAIELALIAEATRGTLPGCFKGEPVSVALLTPEDDPSRTIRPRLEAAGADLARVFDIKMRKEKSDAGVSLPDDTAAIAQALIEKDVRIMLADPLAAMLDPKRNSWKDTDVRGALEPMVGVCQQHDITWLGTLHTNKNSSTDPRTRGIGSVGWRQVARASFVVGLDPDDADGANGSARCIAHDKHNLGPWAPTRRFALETANVSIAGVPQEIVRAVLGQECDVSASQMLAAEQGFEHLADRTEDRAMRWLHEQLEEGDRSVKALRDDADRDGHAWRTVERAKKEIGAKAEKSAHGWVWTLGGGLKL